MNLVGSLGLLYGESGNSIHDPVEAFLTYGVEVCVWSRVHEVDGVGDAVFYGELDCVEVVAEGFAEGQGVLFYPLQELLVVGRWIEDITVLVRAAGVVRHDADFRLADDVATEVLLEVDFGLEGHAEIASLVVGVEEVVGIVDVEDIAPAAAVVGFEECGEAYVVEEPSQSRGYCRLRRERALICGGKCLWGRRTVRGTATPSLAARA